MRQRAYISWVGLRGAVPIVFATYPLIAGIDKAGMIFNIVFFVSVTSVMIQGTTLSVVARLLHVALPGKMKPRTEIDKLIEDFPKSKLREFLILPNHKAVKKQILDLHLPPSAFIVMIVREGTYIRPGGSTQILANDKLVVLADNDDDFNQVDDSLQNCKSETFL